MQKPWSIQVKEKEGCQLRKLFTFHSSLFTGKSRKEREERKDKNEERKRTKRKSHTVCDFFFLVGDGGFEPPKALPADLQSVPFGHSGNPPYEIGAGGRIRTPDLLITNQLLCQLSYTSMLPAKIILAEVTLFVNNNIHKKTYFFGIFF